MLPPNPEPVSIHLRVHTREKTKKIRASRERESAPDWANFALVFDCETTTDLRQDLNFLWWRFCELKNDSYICQQEGIAYGDDLDDEAIRMIREYARGKKADVEDGCPKTIKVGSRAEFVDGAFWKALQLGAVIVCFNAPFDLSRLALEYREARNKNSGWSMVLWKHKGQPDKLKPYLRIKPKDSRSAFINLAGGDFRDRLIYGGRFLDLSVLGWTLRNKHMDLEGFLKSFGLKPKKKHEPTGRVTKNELAYGRTDAERTAGLLNAMKREYDGFQLGLVPEQAFSPASITKAFLNKMKVKQPAKKFDLPDEVLGKSMQSYYGGRSEIRIRHQEVPVVVCDTTSEYPSVAALLNLWPLLTAANVGVEDCTVEAREFLGNATLETLLSPDAWQKLAFFASVAPNGDTLPVRTLYSETGDTNIGLNPLTSEKPIWYAGPDLAGAKLKKGKEPHIIRAFRIVPQGVQEGMTSSTIGTRTIDPGKDDFFRVIIEERKKLAKSHPHYLLLKIIANALYGIFAELNKSEYSKNRTKELMVFSGDDQFPETKNVVEWPGKWQFAPAAALITAGGRLMLALLEHMAEQRGGTYLLTDTDSMLFVASKNGGLVPCAGGQHKMADGTPAIKALTWKEVEGIAATLNSLNPYDPNIVGEILKIEDCNKDGAGNQHQLYGLAVSAKRYVVYKRQKSRLQIIKPSEHGLGIVYVPDKRKRYKPVNCKDKETDYPRWVVEAWERLLADHFRNAVTSEDALVTRNLWFGNFPAVMRVRVTTPNVLKALREKDPGSAKPYNFALSPILVDPPQKCTLVASFSKHPEEWLTRDYTEIHAREKVTLGGEYNGQKLVPQTLSSVLWRHYLHPEDKSLAPDGVRCGPYTSGLLLRRPIQAIEPFEFIGKEIERRTQEGADVGVLESTGPIRYQARQTAKTRAADPRLIHRASQFPAPRLKEKSGVGQHTVERFLNAERVHPRSRMKLAQAIEELERERDHGNPLTANSI